MKKASNWLFLIVLILSPRTAFAAGKVVINSFQIGAEKSTDEFVEILNIGDASVNLSGWRLSKKTASGSISNLLTTFPEVNLDPGGGLVISHRDFSATSDFYYSTSSSFAADNTLVLFSDAGKTVVDKVGFGKAGDFEGAPIPNPGPGEVWLRKAEGQDTDNNLNDFEKEAPESVGGAAVSADILITELMPNPFGSDTEGEWVELYNASDIQVDLGGWTLCDKIGSAKKFIIPAGKIIGKGDYLVLFSSETRISLNNDGDLVELYDQAGNLADSSGASYEKSKEGQGYAFDGETWQWTISPTPGTQNKIEQEESVMEGLVKATKPKTATKKTTAKKAKKVAATKKAKAPKAAVKGAISEDESLFEPKEEVLSENDRLLGYILIAVALGSGLLYTVVNNKEKLSEVFEKERTRYAKAWAGVRAKLPRR